MRLATIAKKHVSMQTRKHMRFLQFDQSNQSSATDIQKNKTVYKDAPFANTAIKLISSPMFKNQQMDDQICKFAHENPFQLDFISCTTMPVC